MRMGIVLRQIWIRLYNENPDRHQNVAVPQHWTTASQFRCKRLCKTCKQCCGPGMFIPDPGSMVKKISDPHQRIQVFLTQKIVFKL
jgi:hypothetical protein